MTRRARRTRPRFSKTAFFFLTANTEAKEAIFRNRNRNRNSSARSVGPFSCKLHDEFRVSMDCLLAGSFVLQPSSCDLPRTPPRFRARPPPPRDFPRSFSVLLLFYLLFDLDGRQRGRSKQIIDAKNSMGHEGQRARAKRARGPGGPRRPRRPKAKRAISCRLIKSKMKRRDTRGTEGHNSCHPSVFPNHRE